MEKFKTVCLGTKKELDKLCLKKYGVDFTTFWEQHRRE